MTLLYWDTSALAKLYAAEPDSPYFLALLADNDEPFASSAITAIELLSVFYRKEHARTLKPGAAKRLYREFLADVDAGRIVTIPFGRDVQLEAEKVVRMIFARRQPLLLRSLDLIHLSTARAASATGLVATEARLREAALLAGLELLP